MLKIEWCVFGVYTKDNACNAISSNKYNEGGNSNGINIQNKT